MEMEEIVSDFAKVSQEVDRLGRLILSEMFVPQSSFHHHLLLLSHVFLHFP
jgi:hypothetical protein